MDPCLEAIWLEGEVIPLLEELNQDLLCIGRPDIAEKVVWLIHENKNLIKLHRGEIRQ